jgi:type II secretory pathway component PulF
LFHDFNATLPTSTKALIATSDFLINNWLLLLFLVFWLLIWLLIYRNTESWKENIDNFILNTPLIWDVYKNYILSNISLTMWNLIWWGVSTIKMLKLVWKASWSHVYNQLFLIIAKKVETWEKIVDSMQEVDVDKFYFPTSFTQLMSVWEKTANLEVVAWKIHNQYKREVEYSLATLTKWIEPLAVLLASIFVLWFAYAIFWAIMKLTSSMN